MRIDLRASQLLNYACNVPHFVVTRKGLMLSSAMLLIGLTGGIATGKSTVARLFQDCGAVVIDADALARQVVEPQKAAWRDIVRVFGKHILQPDRTVNRPALGHIVFRDRHKLRMLNAIIHPRVEREQIRLVRALARRDTKAVVIYDVPLLFEAGVYKRVDRIIVVVADRNTQIRRMQQRNRLTKAEALRRIRHQMPLAQKVKRADYVFDGTWALSRLQREVKDLYARLREEESK